MAAEQGRWYVIHTYSGYEAMVKDSLEKLIENNNLQEKIFEIQIPTEETLEEKANGKKKLVKRKKFPCYVFLKMIYSNDIWYLVTNTRGVTGFVGPLGRPLPLSEEEVKRMHLERPTLVVTDFEIGESVKIIDGSFEGFIGTIDSIDVPKEKCKVTVSMFGRLTPVELDLAQIERLESVTTEE